jgi:two-component system, OmpR family, alkaline phosphatase synthesis response regulator PhoP
MKRILIVDDQPHITHVLKLHLQRSGYLVETAANGKIALDSVLNNAPDVMVTDIQMPVMTGQELCLALEEQLPERTFPIFVMTSMTDREHREWSAQIKNLKFLEKPLSMRALTREFEQYFGSVHD